jgi:imidazolonepropionase-like amidohydrolase
MTKNARHGNMGAIALGLAVSGMLLSGVADPGAVPKGEKGVFFKNVRLFDGTNAISAASVLVEGGRIRAVRPGLAPPAGVEVMDGAGQTLLPGLIDAHVHVWSMDNLRQFLPFGVTSAVDMFTSAGFMAAVHKDQSGPNPPLQAFLVSPGILAAAPGGHGTQYGTPIPTLSGPADAVAFVDDRIAEGSDFIKIIYDDGSAYRMDLPTLSRETLKAVIDAAHARRKMAVVHAGTLKRCREAVEAGADGIAHLNFDNALDPGLPELFAAKKAFVIPTLSVLSSMNGCPDPAALAEDPLLSPYLGPGDVRALHTAAIAATPPGAYAAAERHLEALVRAGVPILAGTDAPNPGTVHGPSLHGELELLVKAGLTPVEALRSATSIPANVFGMTGRGTIAPGACADLVLVEGDPTVDIKATRAIVGVWKSGVRVDREGYLEGIRRAREETAARKSSPPPEDFGTGLISDFEGDTIRSSFGSGWTVSTDAMMGGRSKATLALTDAGAGRPGRSLLVTGTISVAGSIRWAGAFFSPGPGPMSPANLSGRPTLKFLARGTGKAFAVLFYAQSLGFIPKVEPFRPGAEWQEFMVPFSRLGLGGEDIMGIFIGATNVPGDFSLQIDDVRLE